MKKAFAQLKSRFPSAVALLLCVWLSGVTCLFGCGMTSVQNLPNEEAAISALPPCHQKAAREQSKLPKLQPNQIIAADCCPFRQQTADKAGKISLVEVAAGAVRTSFSFVPHLRNRQIVFPQNYTNLPRNRSGTYLLNCIFRI